ncbi:uncharacterized protein LOC141821664 [Curcuma longa]|uniref:uncharacterized protein LOC141821664 n=1 Tax=Curcuma longa TaxID=136217 RepID=UPI003D9E3BF7
MGRMELSFTRRILDEELPKHFRTPQFLDYNGSNDLEDHLGRFENAAILHQYTDAIKCRVFLTTLVGSALWWFSQLPPSSISSFADFKEVFLRHFATSRIYHKTTMDLFATKQRPRESLKEFVHRFNQVAQEVATASSEVLVSAFSQGLIDGDFFRSLIKKPLTNFDALQSRAIKYIHVEEAQSARRKEDPHQQGGSSRNPPTVSRISQSRPLVGVDGCLAFAPTINPRIMLLRNATSMPASYEGSLNSVVKELLLLPGINVPPLGGPLRRTDPPLYGPLELETVLPDGQFHLRKGKLPVSLKLLDVTTLLRITATMLRMGDPYDQEEPPMEIRTEPERLMPDSSRCTELAVAEPNYNIARVFVDTDSSVNIIFKAAFAQMQIDVAELQPMATSLFGFTGNEVQPLGQITLAISLGEEPQRRTRRVPFVIVDAPSTYNVILGRPTLNAFSDVVSTYHQKMKFPVGDQVGEARGDQLASRRCYIDMVRIEAKKNRRSRRRRRRTDGDKRRGRENRVVATRTTG